MVQYDMFFEKLTVLKEKALLREIRDRTSPQGPRVKFNGKDYINFWLRVRGIQASWGRMHPAQGT
jgi:hypothetical protein